MRTLAPPGPGEVVAWAGLVGARRSKKAPLHGDSDALLAMEVQRSFCIHV